MSATCLVALLRGINVGGNNIIPMKDLKACFEQIGFADVRTYIQSGNVIFATTKSVAGSVRTIERGLLQQFSYKGRVVVVSQTELFKVVQQAPRGFGTEPEAYRYDVLFLTPAVMAAEALKQIPVREGVDTIQAGTHVLYSSRLIKLVTKSYLPKIVSLPIYKEMTIRNWNTTTKLLALMEARVSK